MPITRVIVNRGMKGDPGDGFTAGEAAALTARVGTVETRAIDVRDHGAVGGGLGTTVTGAGGNIATIRTETGQAWLQTTDSMDLVAYYRAQVAAEASGRTILFPRDAYVFTGPAFLHASVNVDLGGSTVTSTAANDSRFTRSNRVFVLGILAREDFARFATQGWEQTASTVAIDARTLTSVTGTMPAVGHVLLIRTAAIVGTLPDYTTWNEVAGVSGTTITLRWPIERAIVSPIIVNYSTITTLKSTLVGTGEPHRYFCSHRASLRNGTLVSTDGPAFEFNAALDTDIDIRIIAANGQGVYGNSLNRCRVRVAGVCGGPKSPVELAIGSALSTVEVDLRYSGDDTHSMSGTSGTYPIIQLGEFTEQVVVRGRVDAGNKPSNLGVTFPTANRCLVDCDVVGRGNTTFGISFPSNAGTGNRAKGRHEISALATHYVIFSAGAGTNNWVEDMTFVGDQSGATAVRWFGPNLGGIRGCILPEGKLTFDTGASGNVAIASYVREGVTSGGPNGSHITIKTELGSYPEDDVIVATNLTGSILAAEVRGRTVTNTGATAIRTRTLPVSVAGMYARFYRDNASFALRIDPNGTETIGTGGAGKYLSIDSDKGWVDLRCLATGHWVVTASAGTIGWEA